MGSVLQGIGAWWSFLDMIWSCPDARGRREESLLLGFSWELFLILFMRFLWKKYESMISKKLEKNLEKKVSSEPSIIDVFRTSTVDVLKEKIYLLLGFSPYVFLFLLYRKSKGWTPPSFLLMFFIFWIVQEIQRTYIWLTIRRDLREASTLSRSLFDEPPIYVAGSYGSPIEVGCMCSSKDNNGFNHGVLDPCKDKRSDLLVT